MRTPLAGTSNGHSLEETATSPTTVDLVLFIARHLLETVGPPWLT